MKDSIKRITTKSDAYGAVDGIKDGKPAFHTNFQNDPWWKVDLGRIMPISKILLWNRCDGGPEVVGRLKRVNLRLSDDGKTWRTVWENPGVVFYGKTDNKPMCITLKGQSARYVMVCNPGRNCLFLDEVEVFSPSDPGKNVALGKSADQCSLSPWSSNSLVQMQGKNIPIDYTANWEKRERLLKDPLLDFDSIIFTKRVPTVFNHMSDQYLSWWIRPGGGIYMLKDFKTDHPKTLCLTDSFKEQGSFLRPTLSYDGKKILFAWARYYPFIIGEPNKLDKSHFPEDSFFHLFEMNIDGSGLRQLTHGKYNDIDGRYLPNGRIVFLSTRRGPWIQVGKESAARTMSNPELPECYARCGGSSSRPCAIYTLHTMDANGGDMITISPFEMFEWTPTVAADGSILYSRWDYVDRDNMPYMSLWTVNPDGTNARLFFGNYTRNPHCMFEPRQVPNSNKIVFTACGHHAQTMGSLVLLDPRAGIEGNGPMHRLTPEVPFPESEGWNSTTFYANPWPLSEELYLVSWGWEPETSQGYIQRGVYGYLQARPVNGLGIYLFHADGSREMLYRDPDITSSWPLPVKARVRPPIRPSYAKWDGPQEGTFLLSDVYHGLQKTARGEVKRLRIIAIPTKAQPTKNLPDIGITKDDPGKCLLGTVPVEEDGSAYFRVPSGVPLFFQALDKRGMALYTMRSASYVMPGTTLSCNGCHEPRNRAATQVRGTPMAAKRAPSKIKAGPAGSWPLRFDTLVKPVVDRRCVTCHNPKGKNPKAARFNLALNARSLYNRMIYWGGGRNLNNHVMSLYRRGRSVEKWSEASSSVLLKKISDPSQHPKVDLTDEEWECLIVWMDLYAQFKGTFSDEQEDELRRMRNKWANLIE